MSLLWVNYQGWQAGGLFGKDFDNLVMDIWFEYKFIMSKWWTGAGGWLSAGYDFTMISPWVYYEYRMHANWLAGHLII